MVQIIEKTHYNILSVRENATREELRMSYRSLILSFHPDKLERSYGTSIYEYGEFLKVQKAWEVLGNSNLRADYDSELRALRRASELADDVSVEYMSVEDDGEVVTLFCQCRCCDFFYVDCKELEDLGYVLLRDESGIYLQKPNAFLEPVLLTCGSCSLKVRLLINTNTRLCNHFDS